MKLFSKLPTMMMMMLSCTALISARDHNRPGEVRNPERKSCLMPIIDCDRTGQRRGNSASLFWRSEVVSASQKSLESG
uniref:Putative secreted protein n=1 Tax=Anopheles darlingi TaxID=43151 RepID=A0A2M4DDG8_ANODA